MANELSTVAIEARALPASGYMGLPNAYHIYLVDQVDRSLAWPCFGRSYSADDPGDIVITASIFQELAVAFVQPNSFAQYMGGLANAVNGTCHTIANRILILSDQPNANVSNSVDDPYSVIVFGKYGFGTAQFCELLQQTFATVGQSYSIPSGLLDAVLSRAQNPYQDELSAWEIVISTQLGVNIQALLNSNPALAQGALQVLTSYCKDRDDMYEQCFDYKQGQAPTGAQIAAIKAGLQKLALAYTDNVLDALTVNKIISQDQENTFKTEIDAYINKVGPAV